MIVPPGYRLILDDLRSTARAAAAGTRLPSEHELVRRYAVSRGTARRALDELMREGAAVRVQGKGSFVAQRRARAGGGRGRAARSGEKTIALVVGDVRRIEPLFLHAVERGAAEAGYRLLLASSGADAARETALLRTLLADGVAGCLIRSYEHPGATDGLDALRAAGAPFVLVDRAVAGVDADYVGVDHGAGMREVTRHLLAQGHRRIALLLHRRTPVSAAIEARIEGYRRAHGEVGAPVDERLIVHAGDPGFPDAERGAGRSGGLADGFRSVLDLLLAVSPAVTAWVGVNDVVATAALRHALERGVGVPERLSVAGFDGSALATQGLVPLATAVQPFERLGAESIALLLRRMAARGLPPTTVELPTTLLEGSTTAPPMAASGLSTSQNTVLAIASQT